MKITTLIPAYKPSYLYETLLALVQQTVLPDRVIFSDDSREKIFISSLNSEPIKSLLTHLNVEVIEGPKKGAYENVCHLIRHFKRDTELVHILCDDDVIYPHFYERHLNAHHNAEFSSSISSRWSANEDGRPLRNGLPIPNFIKNHPSRNISIGSDIIFASTIGSARNWLGEVSNTVYRSDFAEKILDRNIDGISYAGLDDLGSFLAGTLILPLCYINEHLGFFRQNPTQNSTQHFGPPLKLAFLAYIAMAIASRNIGKISRETASESISIVGSNIAWHYRNELDMSRFCELMPALMSGDSDSEKMFLKIWEQCEFVV